MGEFYRGTCGSWEKYSGGTLLGGQYGTCFDISMLKEDDEIQMYFS